MEPVRCEHAVSVSDGHDVVGGGPDGDVPAPRDVGARVGESRDVRGLLERLERPVSRPTVHHDDLIGRTRLGSHRVEELLDVRAGILHGRDQRNLHFRDGSR